MCPGWPVDCSNRTMYNEEQLLCFSHYLHSLASSLLMRCLLLELNPAVGPQDGIWASACLNPGLTLTGPRSGTASWHWHQHLQFLRSENIIRILGSIHWYWRDRQRQSGNQINIYNAKNLNLRYWRERESTQVFPAGWTVIKGTIRCASTGEDRGNKWSECHDKLGWLNSPFQLNILTSNLALLHPKYPGGFSQDRQRQAAVTKSRAKKNWKIFPEVKTIFSNILPWIQKLENRKPEVSLWE